MITQTIILSALNYGVTPVLHAMQSDTGRNIQIGFSDFTIPDGATAEIYVKRPDETYYTITATVTEQVVTAELDQAVTCAGDNECNLAIALDGATVQSFPFTVRVLATAAGSPQTEQEGTSVADLADDIDALDDRVELVEGDVAELSAVYTYDEDNNKAIIDLAGTGTTAQGIFRPGQDVEFRVTDSGLPGGTSLLVSLAGLYKGTLDTDTNEWNYEALGGGGGASLYLYTYNVYVTGGYYLVIKLLSSAVLSAGGSVTFESVRDTLMVRSNTTDAYQPVLNTVMITAGSSGYYTGAEIAGQIVYVKSGNKFRIDASSGQLLTGNISGLTGSLTVVQLI